MLDLLDLSRFGHGKAGMDRSSLRFRQRWPVDGHSGYGSSEIAPRSALGWSIEIAAADYVKSKEKALSKIALPLAVAVRCGDSRLSNTRLGGLDNFRAVRPGTGEVWCTGLSRGSA